MVFPCKSLSAHLMKGEAMSSSREAGLTFRRVQPPLLFSCVTLSRGLNLSEPSFHLFKLVVVTPSSQGGLKDPGRPCIADVHCHHDYPQCAEPWHQGICEPCTFQGSVSVRIYPTANWERWPPVSRCFLVAPSAGAGTVLACSSPLQLHRNPEGKGEMGTPQRGATSPAITP